MDWLLCLLMLIAGLVCLMLSLIGLPGLWLMLFVAALYGWATGWASLGPWTLGTLLLLALTAEAIETLAGALGARGAGASKRAMALSIVGTIIGMMTAVKLPASTRIGFVPFVMRMTSSPLQASTAKIQSLSL